MWGTFRDRCVLGDYACWVGDEVGVAIAAESERIAEEALRLVKVEWEVLPFVLDPMAAMEPGAPLVHPEISSDNVFPADPFGGGDVFVDKGDVDEGFKRADLVVEGRAVYHNATQNSLDNWCCLVEWKGEGLTVWSNSYATDQTRMHVSQMLDLPLHKVRAVSSYVGGQFGRGDTGDQPFFLFTALLARKSGRPVKFRHTRRESFHDSRQPAIYDGKVGIEGTGPSRRCSYKSIGNAGAYADHTMFALKYAPKEITEVALAHIADVRFESYGVYTNKLPACMMRGVGNSQFNLVFGLMIDLAAERLGMDPDRPLREEFRPRVGEPPRQEPGARPGGRRRPDRLEGEAPPARPGSRVRGREKAGSGIFLPSRLACRVAGDPPRQGAGSHHPQSRLHGDAQGPLGRDGERLQHLQRPRLRRGLGIPRHRRREHTLEPDRRFR